VHINAHSRTLNAYHLTSLLKLQQTVAELRASLRDARADGDRARRRALDVQGELLTIYDMTRAFILFTYHCIII
jgi:hypothetical protein